MLAGLQDTFKGKVVGEEYTRWPDQLDFSAELSKARASGPTRFRVLSGRRRHSVHHSVRAIGPKGTDPALSGLHASTNCRSLGSRIWRSAFPAPTNWVNDLPNETNKKFVADYIAKYKQRPSYYGAQTYDAVSLLNSAVLAVKGDLSKKEEMRKEMEKADFKSVRGNFKFGNNHIPIQNYYLTIR